MSAQAQNIEFSANDSVTTISANARIDYVLRFKKHAILVVDENSLLCSQVCNSFLAGLPEEQNAALITVSPKLNDIQIRCRIVEQLFPNALFDPEQSIAVSVFNLAKNSNKAISIVVDNIQFASLQLLHELAQISLIASKAKVKINVVLAGDLSAATQAAQNMSLFQNNLSILSAKTGHLLPFSSPLFKEQTTWFSFNGTKKLIISISVLALLSFSGIYFAYNLDAFNFSQLSKPFGEEQLVEQEKDILVPQTIMVKSALAKGAANDGEQLNQPASSENIFNALTTKPSVKKPMVKQEKISPAGPQDVLMALELSTTISSAKAIEVIEEPKYNAVENNDLDLPRLQGINSAYYKSYTSGYAIQLSAFTKQQAVDEFLLANRSISYQGFYRSLGQTPMLVLTSSVYPDKQTALEKLNELSESIKSSGAFIKAVAVINNEINLFENEK